MVRRHYLVSGRVQGVGFRRYVHKLGIELGLAGRVRNLDDGRVEAVAQGPEEAMAEFDRGIATGPSLSFVSSIERNEPTGAALSVLESANGFEVWGDGETPWSEI